MRFPCRLPWGAGVTISMSCLIFDPYSKALFIRYLIVIEIFSLPSTIRTCDLDPRRRDRSYQTRLIRGLPLVLNLGPKVVASGGVEWGLGVCRHFSAKPTFWDCHLHCVCFSHDLVSWPRIAYSLYHCRFFSSRYATNPSGRILAMVMGASTTLAPNPRRSDGANCPRGCFSH